MYNENDYVAKSVDQIGKRKHDDQLTSADSGVFDKISQAINATKELISDAYYLDTTIIPSFLTFVCPVLVVPDDILWQVKYFDDGSQDGRPEKIKHISYFVGKDWTVGDLTSLTYTISHVEIVTFSEVKNFVKKYLNDYMGLCRAMVVRGAEIE